MKKQVLTGFTFMLAVFMSLSSFDSNSRQINDAQESAPISKFVNVEEINDAMHILSRSLAAALYDPALRLIIKGKLDKAVRKDRGFTLKEILSYSSESVSSFKKELDNLNVVKKTYTIDVKKHEGILYKEKFIDSLNIGIFNQDLWLADSVAPYVAAIPFDVEDDKLMTISAYNYAGGVIYLDPNKRPEKELLILRIDDDVVRPPVVVVGKNGSILSASATYPKYVATPVIFQSGITDIHEGFPNGSNGFAYFAAAPSEKAGDLCLPFGGEGGWDMIVWASNFQGPNLETDHPRHQYEFSADGWLQIGPYKYPHMYGIREVQNPADFGHYYYKIMEDDEFLDPDDFVGYVYLDYRPCNLEVFQQGLIYGWTANHTYGGSDDVSYIVSKIFCECKNLPSAPVHISPPSGSTGSSLTPILKWNPVSTYPPVTQYGVEVRKAVDSTLICSTNTTATQVQLPPLEDNTQYKWRVRAVNSEGWGPFSGYWTFTIPQALVPGQVSLLSPANNSTVGSLNPTVRWYAVSAFPEVDQYHIRLMLNSSVVQDNYVTGTQTKFSSLIRNKKYGWKVRAENAMGWGAWSETWYFWTPK